MIDLIEFLKKGSGIHIKKRNRGKFTSWCGGKVTSECIQRGKRSSNPTIRKRATFADNARRWKHKEGGRFDENKYSDLLRRIIKDKKGGKQAFVKGVNVLDSNPNAYKHVKKKYKMRGPVKAQLGTKIWNWSSNVAQVGQVAENPAVMTASGWRVGKNGQVKQDQQNNKSVKQLRSNLTKIGEAGVTAPTMVEDIETLYNIIRHPVQSGKLILNSGQDVLWFLKNPKGVKIYHGTQAKNFKNLKDARVASDVNVGLHVSPNKTMVSERFAGQNGTIIEGYIPKHNMETIDLGYNNYNLLSNNHSSFQYQNPQSVNSEFEKKLFGKYGFRNIPLRDVTWPKMTKSQISQAEKLVEEGKQAKNAREAKQVNEKVAQFFSDNGKKVIKYDNKIEGGISYMVTDPRVFYNPQKYNWNQIAKSGLNFSKYPLIYEIDKQN